MKLKVIVYEAEEGGYWAEVPALPGCASQGDSLEELQENVRDAIEAWLSVDTFPPHEHAQIMEIAV